MQTLDGNDWLGRWDLKSAGLFSFISNIEGFEYFEYTRLYDSQETII